MKKWTDHFGIYLINLPHRGDRLIEAAAQLDRYDIPFKVVDAVRTEDGRRGLNITMNALFNSAQERDLLVFEDDVRFLFPPNDYNIMDNVMEYLRSWHLLYLGANLNAPATKTKSPNVLAVNHAYATHAVAYSREAIDKIISIGIPDTPFDSMLVEFIQPYGKSFMVNPMMCTQANGYSDIEKRNVDYSWMETKFIRYTPSIFK